MRNAGREHWPWIGAVLKQPAVSIVRSQHGEATIVGAFGAFSLVATAAMLVKVPRDWIVNLESSQQAFVVILAVIVLALLFSETVKPMVRVDELNRTKPLRSLVGVAAGPLLVRRTATVSIATLLVTAPTIILAIERSTTLRTRTSILLAPAIAVLVFVLVASDCRDCMKRHWSDCEPGDRELDFAESANASAFVLVPLGLLIVGLTWLSEEGPIDSDTAVISVALLTYVLIIAVRGRSLRRLK